MNANLKPYLVNPSFLSFFIISYENINIIFFKYNLFYTSMTFKLKSYLGKWYEIASVPAWFQKNCQNTTAEYSLRDDGNVQVKNTCDVVKNNEFVKTKEIIIQLRLIEIFTSLN